MYFLSHFELRFLCLWSSTDDTLQIAISKERTCLPRQIPATIGMRIRCWMWQSQRVDGLIRQQTATKRRTMQTLWNCLLTPRLYNCIFCTCVNSKKSGCTQSVNDLHRSGHRGSQSVLGSSWDRDDSDGKDPSYWGYDTTPVLECFTLW